MGFLTIGAEHAGARFAELLDEVTKGKEVVITRDGHPVARLEAVAVASDHVLPAFDRTAAQAHVENMIAYSRARNLHATVEEVIAWKNEGRE